MANDKDDLRIGDSDRELVSRLLKSAVEEGRLTLVEYDGRLQRIHSAKTVGDLTPIFQDLVASGNRRNFSEHGSAPSKSYAAKSRAKTGTPAWIKWMWFGWAVPVTLCVVIWLILVVTELELQYFWPIWVAGPLGAVIGSVTVMERWMIRPVLLERDARRNDGEEFSRS
ncbi:MAG TPA: DUF1707 domain-containing protein [Candidatus Stackebrandtia faecavium]|nr:DUF1707 domain-containing protein [Candidatus Stackebrandtia faecavium]